MQLDPARPDIRMPRVGWDTLAAYGIPHPGFALCTRLDEALEFARSGPSRLLCLKSSSNVHKARAGLVALGLLTLDDVRHAWERLSRVSAELVITDPMLIQDQVTAGPELIVGGRNDPVFGPSVLLGLGGSLAEALRRSVVRLLPIDPEQADEMVRQLLGEPVAGLAELVCAAGQLLADYPGLAEFDVNPVILTPDGPVAVDLRTVPVTGTDPAGWWTPQSDESQAVAVAAIARMMAPRSVAVIGASANPEKPGGAALRHLVEAGAAGVVRLVHSRLDSINGIKASRDIRDLPAGIDVAVIATPADTVPGILRQCAAEGIGSAIVFASGFIEAGREDLEAAVRAAAREGIRVCGVNSIGAIGNLPLTFSRAADYEGRIGGSVSYVTQSGALGGSLLLRSWSQRLGTARFACIGNQTDLTFADYLRYLAADQHTRTVGLFVEGVPDGRDFLAGLRAVRAAGKGLAVLRAGVTPAGTIAARSHTGALAGTDDLYESAFSAAGAYRVTDLPELVAACQALDWQPPAAGGRIGVVATSGGACSALADGCTLRGLELAEWDDLTAAGLQEVLPGFGAVGNPIETTGNVLHNPHLLGQLVDVIAASPQADILLISVSTLSGQAAIDAAEDIIAAGRFGKPIVVCSTVPESVSPDIFLLLRSARVPVFDSFTLGLVGAGALAAAAVSPTAHQIGRTWESIAEAGQGRDHRGALQ